MDKYKNKYRIPSARLQNWDYGWNALYFVTICTQNREHYFGEIIDGEMQLSEIGKIAQKYWVIIPEHFPFVKLDEFVVMPNHIHGIIEIAKINDERNNVGERNNVETPNLGISTTATTTNNKKSIGGKNDKWKPGTLGTIMNQYKRICTINARKINNDWGWQSRFHDHIIRNDKSYNNIKNYIINNPANWSDDKFNPDNGK